MKDHSELSIKLPMPTKALLKLDIAVSVHQRNLRYLMTEIYKTKSSLNPSFMKELFKPRDLQYILGNKLLLIYHKLIQLHVG